jgi:hypothetical protein
MSSGTSQNGGGTGSPAAAARTAFHDQQHLSFVEMTVVSGLKSVIADRQGFSGHRRIRAASRSDEKRPLRAAAAAAGVKERT